MLLHLRRTYHLGSARIVWYLARYHGITISDRQPTSIMRSWVGSYGGNEHNLLLR